MVFQRPSNANLSFQAFFWLMYFFFSTAMSWIVLGDNVKFTLPITISGLFIHIFMVNFNLYFLVPNLYKTKKYIPYFLGLILLLIGCTLLKYSIANYFENENLVTSFRTAESSTMSIVSTLFIFVITLPFLLFDHLVEKERLEGELERQNLESEIRFLRAQINPHFLFNVLNNIYSMIFTGSSHAGTAVLQLSELMRYMLYETSGNQVLLSQEVEYIRQFIGLHIMKQEDNPTVSLEIGTIPPQAKIPPLLLIPFLENAFKYSNWDSEDKSGWIKGAIMVEDNVLIMNLTNTISPIQKVKGDGGIGLSNTSQRLALLFPEKHILDIHNDQAIFSVNLRIELSNEAKKIAP